MKRALMGILVVGVLGLVGYFGFNLYIEKMSQAVGGQATEDIRVEIPQGSSADRIAAVLEENNLIRDEFAFKYLSRKTGLAAEFKAGIYYLDRAMSARDIMEELVSGGRDIGVHIFTIPEGFEIRNMAQLLAEQGIVDGDTFIEMASNVDMFRDKHAFLSDLPQEQGLEGYLYPDTYQIDYETEKKEEAIINMMLSNFGSKYGEDFRQRQEEMGLSLDQVITMASIIEREAQVESERRTISAVFYNRIEDGMRLQSCATVQYILGERKPNLSYEDVRIDSPYNTYMNAGLPPSPIASPGLSSIEAALNPEDVDYFFFVARGDGSHIFSNTYEEHLEAQNSIRN